jgi:hypothetical protein
LEILTPAVARRPVRVRPVGVQAKQCLQAPAKAFRRGDIILPVVPGGGLRPPGLLWVWSAGGGSQNEPMGG